MAANGPRVILCILHTHLSMFMDHTMKGRVMNTILCRFLLACPILLYGGCHARQIPADRTPEKETSRIIQIQNLALTRDALTLDYQVSNNFEDDIRVCHDTRIYANQEVQHMATRIDGETVWIKLSFNLERDNIHRDPPAIAKYVRLSPGESYSGRIRKNLPIKIGSPVRSVQEDGEKRQEIVLRRAIFQVGYFGPKWNTFFDSVSERIRKRGIKPETMVIGKFHYLRYDPLIAEEMQDGRMREVTYISQYWPNLRYEECAEVVIADVNIPCSVVVDDK